MCGQKNSYKWAACLLILVSFNSLAISNAIIYVDDDGPADFNNIQAAIDYANDGDTILVADGTYIGNGNRDIDFKGKAITLKSQNGADTCIIDCQASEEDLHRGFYLHNHEGNDSIIDGFTIMNGCAYYGGGIEFFISNPTVQNCILKDNIAAMDPGFEGTSTSGGGISIATLNDDLCSKIINCKFINNTATGSGGAISSSNSIIQNCEIIGNRASVGGAITGKNLTIYNCVINGNISISNSNYGGGAIFCQSANLIINNSTIVGNHSNSYGGAISLAHGYVKISNTIMVNNTAPLNDEINPYTHTNSILLDISYSDIEGGMEGISITPKTTLNWGTGNIDIYPLFVESGNWVDDNDPNAIVEPNDENATWIQGDYHLKSQAGRFNQNTQIWVQDDVTSPCIDAGDPNSPIGYEPFPNGGYVNMGAYGGTLEASKSYFGKPVCETIVAGDINGDCKVDELDMEIMMIHWLEEH